ncbi:MAG: hypothetical protein ABI600_01130 [Luteolibacter sp.]
MPCPVRHFPLFALALAVFVTGCNPHPTNTAASSLAKSDLAAQLAAARIDAAKDKAPDEALALLVSALSVDSASNEALTAAEGILAETTWNWPTLTLDHRLPVDQIAYAAPSSLWVSLNGLANTSVRWNLETLQIEKVLFSANNDPTRSFILDPHHQFAVIQRGPVTLLCDARSLKPIRDLGPVPDFLTPSAVIVFSPDGLLVAHPAFVSEQDHSIIWHIKDTATGEIVRSSDPVTATSPQPLAAFLDRRELRVLHADGSLLEIPISPVEPVRNTPLAKPVTLLHAQFATNGNSALTLELQGPHQPPVQTTLSFGTDADTSLTPKSLAERFPWSMHPNIWNGLLHDSTFGKLEITDHEVKFSSDHQSPVRAKTQITAAAFAGDDVVVGEASGTLTIHRLLPLPKQTAVKHAAIQPDKSSLTSLNHLTAALSGIYYNEKERTFTHLDSTERLKALGDCDFNSILAIFPALDFGPVIAAAKSITTRRAAPEALLPLWDRLARADASGKSWPDILALSKDLVNSPWHQELTAAIIGSNAETPPVSHWTANARMTRMFDTGDTPTILSAIREAGSIGPPAASALSLALESVHPEWIAACLQSATELPPVLLQIAKSRIAWLEGRKADALSVWPEHFPTLAEIRQREDWEGWEQADYSPALEKLRQCVTDELNAIAVPENSSPEQRKAVADRLRDPVTRATVGRARFANACLNAALAFSAFKEDKETTFQLANQARELGAAPEPCLRAEALALTALGDYKEAHPRWIELITEHPVETHLPGDYAEAAYTAFENADPRQAMEILTTGIHRFPNDGNFALRAGWVALLTGNAERAYQFLQTGQRIGFPAEKLENATALLAIAAAQSGANDDATVYFKDLLKISADWANPQTIETLDWPEELKATLRQLTW